LRKGNKDNTRGGEKQETSKKSKKESMSEQVERMIQEGKIVLEEETH
jgi:hypothetical protein